MPDLKKYDVNYKRFEIVDSDDEDDVSSSDEKEQQSDLKTSRRDDATATAAQAKVHRKGLAQFPLLRAARDGNVETVERLVERREALVTTTDNEGWNALHFAAVEGHARTVERLCYEGAHVNVLTSSSRSALMFAAVMGNELVCKILLCFGADATLKSADGKVASDLADLFGYSKLAELLRDHENGKIKLREEDPLAEESSSLGALEYYSGELKRRLTRQEIAYAKLKRDEEKAEAERARTATEQPTARGKPSLDEAMEEARKKYADLPRDPLTELYPAEFVPGEFGAVEPNAQNGHIVGNYHWGQTPSEVTIYSLLPPGYGKAEVRVQATGDQLTLFKRAPEDTTGEERIHLIVDFWKPIKHDEIMWILQEPEVCTKHAPGAPEIALTLPKRVKEWWLRIDKNRGQSLDLMKLHTPEFLHAYDDDTRAKAEAFFRRLL